MIAKEEKELLEFFLDMIYGYSIYQNSYLYVSTIESGNCKTKYYRASKLYPIRKSTKTLLDEFI